MADMSRTEKAAMIWIFGGNGICRLHSMTTA